MQIVPYVFYAYVLMAILFLIFSKQVAQWFYNVVLILTGKINVSKLFIFRIDQKNRDSMFFLMRSFVMIFAIAIGSTSLYLLTVIPV